MPVAGGSGAVGRGGTTLSDGRRRGAAGRVGIAGTADVPGAFGSSILSLMLGGTMRPGGGAGLAAGAAGAVAPQRRRRWFGCDRRADGAERRFLDDRRWLAALSGDLHRRFLRLFDGAAAARPRAGSSCCASTGAAGFAVFTRRGGASVGAAGFAGSGFLAAGVGFLAPGLTAGPSANMSPPGSVMLRSRARRSTNCRATTSSIVLDALFSSMPCARFSSASTSWLLVLRSSATL